MLFLYQISPRTNKISCILLFAFTENSLSSQEYPRSDTDSIKSDDNSVNSSHSSHQQILTTFHPHAASQERITRSRSCSTSQLPCDISTRDTGQVPCLTNPDYSVTIQTSDSAQSCPPLNSDDPSVKLMCKNCGELNSSRDSHLCKHNSNPPIPPKPSRLRHGKHKELTRFDRPQPPGISRSSNDIQGKLSHIYTSSGLDHSPFCQVASRTTKLKNLVARPGIW